jgi:starch phosphorylase
MKVLANGGLNLSELDGWWAEAYDPHLGWALGDGKEHDDDPGWDAAEALQMYDILEHDIIAKFYERDEDGLPHKWIALMRESMARLTPEFSANRAVREYTEKYYVPSASRYREREASNGALARQILLWQKTVAEHWSKLSFGRLDCETSGDFHDFRVEVLLDDLDPDALLVELFAQSPEGEPPLRQPMTRGERLKGSVKGFLYTARVPSSRPAEHYTPRIVPAFRDVNVPLEAKQILWQR